MEDMSEHIQDCILDAVTQAHSDFADNGDLDEAAFRNAVIVAMELSLAEYKEKGTIGGAKPE